MNIQFYKMQPKCYPEFLSLRLTMNHKQLSSNHHLHSPRQPQELLNGGPTTTLCSPHSSFCTAFRVHSSEGPFRVIAHFSFKKLIKPLNSSWNRGQSRVVSVFSYSPCPTAPSFQSSALHAPSHVGAPHCGTSFEYSPLPASPPLLSSTPYTVASCSPLSTGMLS